MKRDSQGRSIEQRAGMREMQGVVAVRIGCRMIGGSPNPGMRDAVLHAHPLRGHQCRQQHCQQHGNGARGA